MAQVYSAVVNFHAQVLPLISGPSDWIKDAFWGWIKAFVDMMKEGYTWLLQQTVELLIHAGVISTDSLHSGWYQMLLGGTYGLASRLIGLVAVMVAFWIIILPMKNHGEKIGRMITSMLFMIIFGALFFPLYSVAAELSREFSQSLYQAVSGSQSQKDLVDQLISGAIPTNLLGAMITTMIGGFIMLIVVVEVFFLNLWLLFLLLGYPLVWALRPIGRVTNVIFHTFNCGLFTVLVAPPVMVFWLVLSIGAVKVIPFADNALGAAVFTQIGGLAAAITPVALAMLSYRRSSHVFGRVDSEMDGAFDINRLPPVTTRQMRDDVDETYSASVIPLHAKVTDNLVNNGETATQDAIDTVKRHAASAAASKAATALHPAAGVAVAAGYSMYEKHQTNKREEEGAVNE
ncbi:MAG TPA: hypothetical protein VFL81_01670 [Candidatus Saccharimonadales bacterium]|nr:hypothetical protein [Candidatus Saccharimonadales bacterium]